MTKKKIKKRAFTIVELVVVIAIIAILAAVLIPTFVNLVKRANEANALLEAKNLITEMLAEMLLGKEGDADLLVFSQKGNDVYAYGYDASAGRILAYKGNPVPVKSGTFADFVGTGKENSGGDTPLLALMLKNGEIEVNTAVNMTEGSTDWRTPAEVKKIVDSLNTKYNMIVFANYLITENFEKKESGGEEAHVHSWADDWTHDETHHWHNCTAGGCDITDNSKKNGYEAHVYDNDEDTTCDVCGYVRTVTPGHTHEFNQRNTDTKYRKSAASCTSKAIYYYSCICGEKGTETFEYGEKTAHTYSGWTTNATEHWHHCSVCNNDFDKATHSGNPCSVCGYEDKPVEVKIPGVAAWSTEADHKDDNGNTIGSTDLLSEYGVTMTASYCLFHTMTITYTIPEGTPANAKIILEQPTDIKPQLFSMIAPLQSFGITYKIINNSGNTYGNISATFNSNLVETIVKTDSIIKLENDKWICVLNDGTYEELSSNARPLITQGGPFAEYVTWLKNAGKTTCTSVTDAFITEYYNTHSITEGQRFIDFVKTLPDSSTDSTVTTKANVYEKMSGGAGSKTSYRHVEGEVIKQMILFQQKSMIGYAFVENKYDANDKTSGWKAVDYKTYLSGKSADEYGNYSPIVDWDNLTQSSLKVTSAVDLLASGASLVYKTNGNTTTAGAALIWHGFAGNAWQEVEICDFLSLTIVMEK